MEQSMMGDGEAIRVYVGADRSQLLAVSVLEHSIKRHTNAKLQVIPMVDLPVPKPLDPRNGQRTGFSFSRFCIPRLAGYKGKAIYMDADMLVFRDIRELWQIPFDGAKVVIQREVKHQETTTRKEGAPSKRIKQCAVMLLDCERLNWTIEGLVSGMDEGKYDYEQLMYQLCVLDEADVNYGIPFEWNSLEHADADTRLLHYTDVYTQPWTYAGNPFGDRWFAEVRLMLQDGSLRRTDLRREIELGYFRPSLVRDVRFGHLVPGFLRRGFDLYNRGADKAAGFVAHKAVYEAKKERGRAIQEYLERTGGTSAGGV